MTRDALAQELAGRGDLRDGDWRFVPTHFDPDAKHLAGYPLDPTRRWTSLSDHLSAHRSRGLLSQLPAFWQANFSAFEACRSLGIPLFSNDPENAPLGAAALSHAGVDSVLTTGGDAQAFAAYVREKGAPLPKAWFIVHSPDESWSPLEHIAPAMHEVHIFPGIPLFEQCAALAKEARGRFHLSADFALPSLSPVACSTRALGPVAFESLLLERSMSEESACACGKTIYKPL
jgi:hypothetical protein